MVQTARLRSRGLDRSFRSTRLRSRMIKTVGAKPTERRYPQMETLYRAPRAERQRTGDRRVGELLQRSDTDERPVVQQLRQLAKVFPGSRVINE